MIQWLLRATVHKLVQEALEAHVDRVKNVTAAIAGGEMSACPHKWGKWKEHQRLTRTRANSPAPGAPVSIIAEIVHMERTCEECGEKQRKLDTIDFNPKSAEPQNSK